MKHTRFASFAIGGLALGLSIFGFTGCQDSPTDATSVSAVSTSDEQLYTIYKFDETALVGEDMLPTYDEAMSGCVLGQDGALLLPPPPPPGGDTTHGGGGRDTVRNGGDDHGGNGGGRDTTHHGGGGRDTVRNGGDDHGGRDTTHPGGGGRDTVRNGGDDHGGRDTVRRDPPRRDDAILNVHNIERLLRSLPGMNDSLLRTMAPCFRDYRAAVDALKRSFNSAVRDLREQFNQSIRELRADSTLTPAQKREQFNQLKDRFQTAARELKSGLDTAMRGALGDLVDCISQYLSAEQLEAFRAGLANLR